MANGERLTQMKRRASELREQMSTLEKRCDEIDQRCEKLMKKKRELLDEINDIMHHLVGFDTVIRDIDEKHYRAAAQTITVMIFECKDCGTRWEESDINDHCPHCGSMDIMVEERPIKERKPKVSAGMVFGEKADIYITMVDGKIVIRFSDGRELHT